MDLTPLRRKYAAMVALRARRDELEASGAVRFPQDEARTRRVALRQLASEFPGSLRELDETRTAALQQKLAEIVACDGDPARWMVRMIDFHRTLRELLALKAWLAAGGDVAALAAWHAAWPHDHGLLCDVDPELVRRPPEGRLVGLVIAAVDRVHGREHGASG